MPVGHLHVSRPKKHMLMKRLQSIKYIFPLLFLYLMWLSPNALKAQRQFGGGITFGTASDDIGVSLRMRLPINETFVIAPSVDLLEFGRNRYFVTLNGEAQAIFPITNEFSLYPAAGLSLAIRDPNHPLPGEDNIQLGINLGGGANYRFTPRLVGFGELKATVAGFEQLLLTLGVMVDL